MRKINAKSKLATVALAIGLAAGGVALATPASAQTDSTSGYGVTIQGEYYNNVAHAGLCNHQSSASSFYLEIWDTATNSQVVGATTPTLAPGACTGWYWLGGYPRNNDPIQVWAISWDNWSFGTNTFYDN